MVRKRICRVCRPALAHSRAGLMRGAASIVAGIRNASLRLSGHYLVVVQSAEFEAEIAAHRVDIQALRVEARRLESRGGDVSEPGVTIPAGWLPTVAEALGDAIDCYEQDDAGERAADQPSKASGF